MDRIQQIGIRLAISIGVAAVVAVTICLVGWRTIGALPRFRLEVLGSAECIREVERWITEYQRTTNGLPQSLAQLESPTRVEWPVRVDRGNMPLDGWGRPLVYSVRDGKPIVMSHGRDGKPGGVGLDCDISNEDLPPDKYYPVPRKAHPTLEQFLTDPSGSGVRLNCVGSGMLAFVLAMVLVKPVTLRAGDAKFLLVRLAITIAAALATAWFMRILDIPNHH